MHNLTLLLYALMARPEDRDGRELSLEPNLLQKDISTCSITGKWYLSNTIILQGWHKAITISDWYIIWSVNLKLYLWLFYTFLPIYHEFISKNVSFLYPGFNRKCLFFTFKWSLMMIFHTFYEFTFCYLTFQFAT